VLKVQNCWICVRAAIVNEYDQWFTVESCQEKRIFNIHPLMNNFSETLVIISYRCFICLPYRNDYYYMMTLITIICKPNNRRTSISLLLYDKFLSITYCQPFVFQAEELNAVVANAFKLAYDGQRNDPSTVTADVGGSVNHAPARTAAQPQHDIYRGQVDSQPPQSKDRQTGGSKQTDSVISYQYVLDLITQLSLSYQCVHPFEICFH